MISDFMNSWNSNRSHSDNRNILGNTIGVGLKLYDIINTSRICLSEALTKEFSNPDTSQYVMQSLCINS